MEKNKKGPLTAPQNTANIIISENSDIVNANENKENKNIITQIAGYSVYQRNPIVATPKSLMFINDNQSIHTERYYSVMSYVVPSINDFKGIPLPSNKETQSEKTAEYCARRFAMLPSLICDFDCHKGNDNRPDENDLDMLTKHIITLAAALDKSGIQINKDAAIYFTGMKGYRLVIPYPVIGLNAYGPGTLTQITNDIACLSKSLIQKFASNPEFLLSRLDQSSFAKDRIMRAAYSCHPETKIIAFPLDSSDIRSGSGIVEIKKKAKDLYEGTVMPLNFSDIRLKINPVVNALYLKMANENASDAVQEHFETAAAIPGNGQRAIKTLTDRRHCMPESCVTKCACLEYFVKHCDKLVTGESSNRFEQNFPFVVLAKAIADKQGVLDFHKAVAQKIRPGQDATITAEEWTVEIFSSLDGYQPSCKSIETPDGKKIAGTYTRLRQLIKGSTQKPPRFSCPADCPFRPQEICIDPTGEVINQWAVDYVRANIIISYQQTLYRYDEGYYRLLKDEEIEKDISDYLGNHFTLARLKQIKEKIRTMSIVKNLNTPEEMICINNGILDLKTFTIRPHAPELIFFGKIRINYIPDSPPPESDLLDNFLTNLFPGSQHQDDKNILMKFAGYCFTAETGYGFAVVMTSDGNSGKTKFAMFLLGVLGEENYVSMDLDNISDSQHAEKLKNKRLCYIDEIGMSELLNDGCIKSRITGGIVSYNTKYKPTNEFKGTAKFLFGTNTPVIQTNDFSEGFLRRFVMVKFPVNFDDPVNKDKKIVDVEKMLLADQNAKDRFFFLAMESLKELRQDGGLRIPDTKRRENRELLQANNMYHDFASKFMFYSLDYRTLKSDIYRIACAYAKDNGKKIGNARRFWQEIKRVMKCSIEPGVPGTKYLKSGGHEYVNDIQIKGIKLTADKHQFEYITLDNRSMENREFIISPIDVSVVEMTYEEYEAHSQVMRSTQSVETSGPSDLEDNPVEE